MGDVLGMCEQCMGNIWAICAKYRHNAVIGLYFGFVDYIYWVDCTIFLEGWEYIKSWMKYEVISMLYVTQMNDHKFGTVEDTNFTFPNFFMEVEVVQHSISCFVFCPCCVQDAEVLTKPHQSWCETAFSFSPRPSYDTTLAQAHWESCQCVADE